MYIHATHTVDGAVVIICIHCGSPKDYTEVMVTYFVVATGIVGCDNDLANFTITE